MPQVLEQLRKRRDFLAANKGVRAATDSFVLLLHPRKDDSDMIRVGFTVTKRIGNAVIRNRLKRRLRAASRDVLADEAPKGADIVLIGRSGGLTTPYTKLTRELAKAVPRAEMKL